MTAALTKSIFSFGRHCFPSSYRVSAYRHYEDVLVFSYGEYNCLQALAPCSAKITGDVAHRNVLGCFFFSKLRQLDGNADVLFLQIQ